MMNYDPGLTWSGKRAKQIVRLTFGVLDYRLTVEHVVNGNLLGFDVIEAAIENQASDFWDDFYGFATMTLTNEDGDTLVHDDEEDDPDEWLKRCLVCAEIVSIEPFSTQGGGE